MSQATVISVGQNTQGMWSITIDGSIVGDARWFSTRDEAIVWVKKFTKGWQNVVYSGI